MYTLFALNINFTFLSFTISSLSLQSFVEDVCEDNGVENICCEEDDVSPFSRLDDKWV
jgi:hypothetical protein